MASTSLETIDQWVRQGRLPAGRRELQAHLKRGVKRPQAALFANLAWRVERPIWGARVLNPIVRGDPRHPAAPSPEEAVEYAQCLTKAGAAEEALALLRASAATAPAQAMIYEAAARISLWDYSGAVPLLERAAKAKGIADYQRIVARVNLAGALVYERQHRKASYLLHELIELTGVRSLHLLHRYLVQLCAYESLLRDDFSRAKGFLDQAERLTPDADSLDGLFLRKWRAVLRLRQQGYDDTAAAELHRVRSEAQGRSHWETLRDCDRFECLARKNETLFCKVYFGTPYESFRKRLVADFGRRADVADGFTYELAKGSSPTVIDVEKGSGPGGEPLALGGTLHRLLLILASDFYRPFRLPSLFSRLYPDEKYHPVSSVPRVHQSLKLLRKWFASEKLPLSVTAADNHYRLAATGPCRVKVRLAPERRDRHGLWLRQLRECWPADPFSAAEACKLLDVSDSTLHRVLAESIRDGSLEKLGTTARVRYRFRTPNVPAD